MRPQLFGFIDQYNEPATGRGSGAIRRPPLAEAFPYLILDARDARVREAGVIVSQAVLIAMRSASTGTPPLHPDLGLLAQCR